MRKSWKWIAHGLAFTGMFLATRSHFAQARPNYLEGFKAAYPALKEAAEASKCGVCHFGEKKTNRNDYGKTVGQALGAKAVKNAKAVEKALKKAEAGKSSIDGKTFGDLLKDGTLPGKNP